MIIKSKSVRINTDNVSAWNANGDRINFHEPGAGAKEIQFDDREMASRSMAMIDRHLSRGRGSCNLDLLNEYDKKGHVVLLTELIRRTINRIAGRLGL